MTLDLGRRLLASGAVSNDQIQVALFLHITRGIPFLRALHDTGVSEEVINQETSRSEIPCLNQVQPSVDVMARLPAGMCDRLLALPVRVEPTNASVDVAVADPFGRHIQREFEFHLRSCVRLVHAPLRTIETALLQANEQLRGAGVSPSRLRKQTPTFGSAAPRIALPLQKKISEIPIPLVRKTLRSKSIRDPDDVFDEADNSGRIARDAIVLDPGSLPAARPSLTAFDPEASDVMSPLDVVIPAAAAVPHIEEPPQNTQEFSEVVAGLETALEDLKQANSRDEVVLATLHGMAAAARRVGIFAVRRETFTGWACTRSFASESAFRKVRIDRHDETIFARASSEGWYLGLVPDDANHAPLAGLIQMSDGEVALVAVRLRGRPAMLILATQLIDTMIATRVAERLADASSKALLRVLRMEKRQIGKL
ncbi:MAG: hypothetical protein CSA75_01980 [Sorangium cellulosum]|nr:MAG: hypothetical protein CSA75_01980 [Sorangium cellulosum]